MFRSVLLAGSVALALGPGSSPLSSQSRPVDLEAADCSAQQSYFGDLEIARATQHVSVPVTGTLEVRPGSNNGVRIERGPGGAFGITACISAGARSQADARRAADSVRIVVEGNRVRLNDDRMSDDSIRSWSVMLIVTAPDGASIDADTTNGPISVAGLNGTFDLEATNGPIALSDVSGQIKARASNGPISVRGGSGDIDAQTANGPITVSLAGQRWDGHLTASAVNGPLTLNVPAGYQSGVEVTSSFHSPWKCSAEACRSGNRDWNDRTRSLHIGSAPVVVRLTTQNGPVNVRDR